MQNLLILGSTGSVGQSTLDVVEQHPDVFSVFALTAGTNVERMLAQCCRFKPRYAVMSDTASAHLLENKLKQQTSLAVEVLAGEQALSELAAHQEVDVVMSAIVGAAGLLPTLSAIQQGKKVLIANKEPLVMAGDIMMREAEQCGATILPIDSEHNAIFQCLPDNQDKSAVKYIHLTGSGGPFRGQQWQALRSVTPDEACAHPNWSMGRKISVDSATMMNKGLEFIEAVALFKLPAERIKVLIHPQSIIHSMVEYVDGSFIAQLGAPDMKIPIAHALAWPQRITSTAQSLDLTQIAQLDFEAPDLAKMPCLSLAQQVAREGGSATTVMNAANEEAVAAFLDQRMTFTDIPVVIETALESIATCKINDIEHVLSIDKETRAISTEAINRLSL